MVKEIRLFDKKAVANELIKQGFIVTIGPKGITVKKRDNTDLTETEIKLIKEKAIKK